jgi:hypothetical protein
VDTVRVALSVSPEFMVKHDGLALAAGPKAEEGEVAVTSSRCPYQVLPQVVAAEKPFRLVIIMVALTVEPGRMVSEPGLALTA